MADLLLYLSLLFVGFLLGSKCIDKKEKFSFVGKIQTICIFLLVFTMGTRMGSNREIIDNLKTIGLSALLFTVIIFVFVMFSLHIARKALRMNAFGDLVGKDEKKGKQEKVKFELNKMTVFVVLAVLLGMIVGYFLILSSVEKGIFLGGDIGRFSDLASTLISIELCLLLFFVGIDLGFSKGAFSNIKKVGLRILVFPIVTILASLLGGVISSVILGLSIKEGLMIASGFGWYSLAPGIIMDAGYITASAISFLHNVLREMAAILFIPFVAKGVGYIETTGLPGAAAMDVCLPVLEKSTKPEVAIYGFISGVILSFLVPILVPLIISL